jgi:hypothetical protein
MNSRISREESYRAFTFQNGLLLQCYPISFASQSGNGNKFSTRKLHAQKENTFRSPLPNICQYSHLPPPPPPPISYCAAHYLFKPSFAFEILRSKELCNLGIRYRKNLVSSTQQKIKYLFFMKRETPSSQNEVLFLPQAPSLLLPNSLNR